MVPDKTHLSKLNAVKLLTFVFQIMEEQGYIDSDGYLTPLGEQYLAAMTEGQTLVETFDVPLESVSAEPPTETVTLNADTVRELKRRIDATTKLLHGVDQTAPYNLNEIENEEFRWALQAVRDDQEGRGQS